MVFTLRQIVYIISGCLSTSNLLKFSAIFMLSAVSFFPQTGGTIYGSGLLSNSGFGFRQIKDWEFTMISGAQLSGGSGNIYLLSSAKSFDDYLISASYTPGLQKEFILKKNSSIIFNDTTNITTPLKTELTYKELFGFDLSYKVTENITMGTSISRLEQIFVDETAEPFFSLDTISFITTNRTGYNTGIWKADIGVAWEVNNQIKLSLYSDNLLFSFEEPLRFEDGAYDFSKRKAVFLATSYTSDDYNISANLGSNNFYQLGAYYSSQVFKGIVTGGASISRFPESNNIIDLVNPYLEFRYNFISLSLAYLKYLNSESASTGVTKFQTEKLHSTIFNNYENDKILLNVSVSLSFQPEKSAKFLELKKIEEIYPTLTEKYNRFPFATARVKNTSDKKINVKPASRIDGINEDLVYSPFIEIMPGDTADIPFFTVISGQFSNHSKRFLTEANFYLITENSDPDDILQKPVIIGGINEWDGQIVNLAYFVKKDFETLNKLVKEKLQQRNPAVNESLHRFETIKFLFENFASGMEYVSDPRASGEYVQFPLETLELRGGDCDDLSVAFSAMLESVGIPTAFVDYKNEKLNHVNLLINTGIPAGYGNLITNNDKKYHVRENLRGEGEIWIPLELTIFTSFEDSWNLASEKFYTEGISEMGLLNSKVNIVDVR